VIRAPEALPVNHFPFGEHLEQDRVEEHEH
jgi:hypothetical protein